MKQSMETVKHSGARIWSQIKRQQVFGITVLAVIGLYVGLYWALGQGMWSRSPWDSYTLQALAWWQSLPCGWAAAALCLHSPHGWSLQSF